MPHYPIQKIVETFGKHVRVRGSRCNVDCQWVGNFVLPNTSRTPGASLRRSNLQESACPMTQKQGRAHSTYSSSPAATPQYHNQFEDCPVLAVVLSPSSVSFVGRSRARNTILGANPLTDAASSGSDIGSSA